MDRQYDEIIEALQEGFGYMFKDMGLLMNALTHRSYSHEHPSDSQGIDEQGPGHYERLEFLGDAVLALVVADLAMRRFPQVTEGELSRVRAGLVNWEVLASLAGKLGIGRALRLGRGEESSGGRDKPSILAAAYEAVLGAVYLDGGFDAAYKVVAAHFSPFLETDSHLHLLGDYKTPLQEKAQALFKSTPSYKVVHEEGPEHMKWFEVQVYLNHRPCGRGRGRSKKEAEQDAARKALLSGIFDE